MIRPLLPLLSALVLTFTPAAPFAVPAAAANAEAPTASGVPDGVPLAALDLTTAAGVAAVSGAWRHHEARIVEVPFRDVGPDRKPSGPPNRTLEIEPRAGAADFEDAAWPVIEPGSLGDRRGHGRVSFAWYRFSFRVPEELQGIPTSGTTLVFETIVDDYAEVWVDGRLPRALGQTGGSVVAGFNARNRVVAVEDARPGQVVRIAVFGMNGPISAAPENYIWVRSATLSLYNRPRAVAPESVRLLIDRRDPALDALVAPDAQLERVATGFRFTEGPLWRRDGSLLFSDPNANTIYRWDPASGVAVFRPMSGYAGADVAEYRQPGSNGLAFDREGRLTICEHGNRRISRIEPDGRLTVLADRHEGKRLNSPNDLIYRSDGTLYFTDPPFGLPRVFDDPRKEISYSGVYCLKGGVLTLAARDLTGPNGLAFSPDERYLYVTNWDTTRKIVMRYRVEADGSLDEGRVLFDMTGAPGEEALDGVKVDRLGNLYVAGPGGIWVLSPEGRHLGTLAGPELAANLVFGGDEGRTLYWTARGGIYRVGLGVSGATSSAAMTERLPR